MMTAEQALSRLDGVSLGCADPLGRRLCQSHANTLRAILGQLSCKEREHAVFERCKDARAEDVAEEIIVQRARLSLALKRARELLADWE